MSSAHPHPPALDDDKQAYRVAESSLSLVDAGPERTRMIGRGTMERTMTVDIPPGGTRGAKAPPRGAVGRTLMGVARRMHRLTGSKISGRPLLYLTTVGAKTGQLRTAVVMPFPEGDDAWLIVASANGAAGHPAWLYNLAAHPDQVEIEVEHRKTAVTPQTLSGEERAAAWERITRERPNFADYEHKTDRDIPVVRLVAR